MTILFSALKHKHASKKNAPFALCILYLTIRPQREYNTEFERRYLYNKRDNDGDNNLKWGIFASPCMHCTNSTANVCPFQWILFLTVHRWNAFIGNKDILGKNIFVRKVYYIPMKIYFEFSRTLSKINYFLLLYLLIMYSKNPFYVTQKFVHSMEYISVYRDVKHIP